MELKKRDIEMHMTIYGIDLKNVTDFNNYDFEKINFYKRCLYKLYKIYINIDESHSKYEYHLRANKGITLMANGKYIQRF